MPTAFAYIIAIIGFVIVLNFVMLWFRLKRDRYRKPSRETVEEEKAIVLRNNEIKRRIAREQEDAAREVALRNQTLALYEEVRRRAAAREKEAAGNAADFIGAEVGVRTTDFVRSEFDTRERDAGGQAPGAQGTGAEAPGLWPGDWSHKEK